MKQIIGIVLIVVALGLGYMGITKLDNSEASVSIGNVELSASDGDSKATAYVYLGLAVASLIGGVVMIGKK